VVTVGVPFSNPPPHPPQANHSENDESTIKARQADPHSHALVLDPYHGCIAYVPDLGMDLIRQMYFNEVTGEFTQLSEIKYVPTQPVSQHPVRPSNVRPSNVRPSNVRPSNVRPSHVLR
jgi:hypothetical protein